MRILLLVDYPYWISQKIAENICKQVSSHKLLICSKSAWEWLRKKHPPTKSHFHVVHFLTPHLYPIYSPDFHNNTKFVTHVHHLEDDSHNQTINKVDAIAFVCKQWEQEIRHRLSRPIPIYRIGNGVDFSLFHPPQQDRRKIRPTKLRDSFVIGFIGKFSSNTSNRKRPDYFISIISELSKRINNLGVHIVGVGWEPLVQDLRNLGVNVVHTCFLVSERKLAKFYKGLDVYLVCSSIEGGPVPLIEAMSCGTVVASTPVGLANEYIIDGTSGYLIPFNNAEASADILTGIAKQESLTEIRVAASSLIRKSCSWNAAVSEASNLYDSLKVNITSAAEDDHHFIHIATTAYTNWELFEFYMEQNRLTAALRMFFHFCCSVAFSPRLYGFSALKIKEFAAKMFR